MTFDMTTRPYRLAECRAVTVQKNSGYPTQQRGRSTVPGAPRRKQKHIHQIRRIVKRVKWARLAVLSLAVVGVFHLFEPTGSKEQLHVETMAPATESEQLTLKIEHIFGTDDGTPVNMQEMTSAWAAEAGFEKRYDLTDAERWEVASVVTAEAGGEPYAGMIAVAQCILQACEDDGIRPDEAVIVYKYTANRPEPSAEALKAVQAVFDFGQVATTEPIKYFYAKSIVNSEFHESQNFALEINGHRFFSEVEK